MVRIPEDPKIRDDLRKIQKTTTSAGNVRFVADGDDSTKVNGHADRFWALALAPVLAVTVTAVSGVLLPPAVPGMG